MEEKTTLSFGAKSLLLELKEAEKGAGGLTRRDFIGKSITVAGGVAIFSIVLNSEFEGKAYAADCSCHAQCYSNCHSDCGRKTW